MKLLLIFDLSEANYSQTLPNVVGNRRRILCSLLSSVQLAMTRK